MAYNLIHTGSFNDIIGDRIDIYIYQNNYTGAVTPLLLDSNPLLISYPIKDFDSQLFGGGVKINVINSSTNFFRYDSLFSVPEKSNFVEIIKTSSNLDASIKLFEGYILPELYSSTLEKNIRVTIPATDQLSILDRYTPLMLVDDPSYRSPEYVNAFDLISSILLDADVTDKIAIHNNLYNKNYVKDASSTVFNNVFFSADAFIADNGIQNEKTCLEKILKPFYSRCYYHNGKWIIERLPDITQDTKDFTYYIKDDYDISSYIYDNTRIALDKHDILSKSATLSFNPGYSKVVTTLNYKLPPSLLENYYYDFEYYNNDSSSISRKPLPKYRKWMMSDTDVSLYAQVYNDTNLTSGLYYTANVQNWGLNPLKFLYLKDQYASSCFEFTPNKTETVIDVKYTYSVDGDLAGTGESVNGNFAIRANDSNGKDWWIAKSTPDDNSTYWSATRYLFNASIAYEDLLEDNFKFQVAEKVNITAPIVTDASIFRKKIKKWKLFRAFFFPVPYPTWRKQTITVINESEYASELFLDVYPISRTSSYWAGYAAFNTKFGDVDVDIKTDIPYNVLEASIGIYNNIVEKELDLFDVSSLGFVNGMYNLDSSDNIRMIGKWKDKAADSYIKIQEKYMEDLAQMYSYPRYGLDIDIRSIDSSIFTLGNIYTHTNIRYPDSSLVEFICNGYDYNVKNNSYRLSLLEFISDNNWRVSSSDNVPVETPNFYVYPTDVSFDGNGATNNMPLGYVNVSTNKLGWTDSISGSWISTYAGFTGKQREYIWAEVNTGAARDGSILITPEAGWEFTPTVINVHQDASIYTPPEETTLSVNPENVYVPGDGDTLDISIYSNKDWVITEISNPSASVDTSTGSGNGGVVLTYPSYFVDCLEWYLQFETTDGSAFATVSIFQNCS